MIRSPRRQQRRRQRGTTLARLITAEKAHSCRRQKYFRHESFMNIYHLFSLAESIAHLQAEMAAASYVPTAAMPPIDA